MLGKLSTHEFAFGGPSFDLPWPPARNPWNPDHFTAGSSSRHRGGGRRRHDPRRHRVGYRRVDPRPGGALRHRRHQADLWPLSPRRDAAAGVHRSTMPGRWPGRWRIAPCCCRRWPATIPTDPASADRPGAGLPCRAGRGGEGPAHRRGPPLPRGRQPGQPGDAGRHRGGRRLLQRPRAPWCATSRCPAGRLQRLRLADPAGRGLVGARAMDAPRPRALWRAAARPLVAGRAALGRRLPGGAEDAGAR